MKRALFCSLVLAAAIAGLAPAAPAATSAAVRVMSFNVRYGTAQDGTNHWDQRKEFLADTIKAFDPDLLGTQETLTFQRDFLVGQFAGFTPWGVGRDDGSEKGEMALLLYRETRFERIDGGHFWLSETPEKPGSRSWDSSLPRIVSWVKLRDRLAPAGAPLLFVNTHFDHKGAEARLESARLLRSRIGSLGPGCRVVLTGDFNTDQGSEPYAILFGTQDGAVSPVGDAFRLAHPQPTLEEGTFNGFRTDAVSGPRIDWIGVSRDWKVTAAHIDRTTRNGRVPSDHFPVCAVLSPE